MVQIKSINTTAAFVIGATLVAATFLSIPLSTFAATYAYVDTTGDVKSVIANDWMTAIKMAPGIHMRSGVLLLNTAADYNIVGNDVSGS
ncbi:hypothetical protein K2X96_00190 [Patescibacteria group bacterium]|jgi:hypothetical protein|nr:hypothetical protein [Patescibacteria group bacterium]